MTINLELDRAYNGQTVTLVVGQGLHLTLAENPTTGYLWSVTNSGNLILGSSTYAAAGSGVGSGGTREFVWRATTAGSVQLSLSHRRAWEPSDKALEHFALSVVVTEP